MNPTRNDYALLDSGDGRKLERFGDVVLSRPCAQAAWDRADAAHWSTATASYDRDTGWQTLGAGELPSSWIVTVNGITLKLSPTPAGHLGVFPETRGLWDWIGASIPAFGEPVPSVLNLFAYSGGATLAAAKAGCPVCHVDSSRSMVTRARENAGLNALEDAPIRWIVEDAMTFVERETRRGRRYDAIMLDPPSFGHGTKGEQYRIERDLTATLERCREVLRDRPAFVLLTSHTQGTKVAQLERLMAEVFGDGPVVSGVMELTGEADVRPVPDGMWVRWSPRGDR